MMRKQNRPARRSGRSKGGMARDQLVHQTHPPPIKPQIVHRQRMRFQCTTGGTQNVTYQNLLDTMLVATSATAVYEIFDVVRIRAVELWAASTTLGTPLTVGVQFNGEFTGGLSGDGRIISDTVMGTEPAHVLAKPDKRSASFQWNASTIIVACTLTVPTGAIIDFDLEFKNSVSAPQLAQNVAVGATVGQFYYRGLDGVAYATTKFGPITIVNGSDVI